MGVAHLPHHLFTYFYILMPGGQSYIYLVVVGYYLFVQYFLFVSFGIARAFGRWDMHMLFTRLILSYKVCPC